MLDNLITLVKQNASAVLNNPDIPAEKKEEAVNEKEKVVRKEFKQPAFKRSFTLDEKINAEAISAQYVNGVLTLNLQRKEEVKTGVKAIVIQ